VPKGGIGSGVLIQRTAAVGHDPSFIVPKSSQQSSRSIQRTATINGFTTIEHYAATLMPPLFATYVRTVRGVADVKIHFVMRGKTTKSVIILGVFIAAACYWTQHAHIEAIEMSRFRAHRGDYEMLLTMLRQDKKLTFVNSALTLPDDPVAIGISTGRIAEYRRFLSRLDRGALLYEPALGSALFVADGFGDDNILYFPNKSPMQAHHIEDDWYLSSENF
jgi:hypothetical protein